jgi:hypothetical protein
MSGITSEMPVLSASAFGDSHCAQCGSELAEDQEWCLECGAARTLIHRAADWRIPLAIMGTVALLVLAGFAIALVNLSSHANDAARTVAVAVPAAHKPAVAATTAKPAKPAAPTIGTWPVGLSGWTAVVYASRDKPIAVAEARRLSAARLGVGLLDSSQHPSMTPGYWVVFFGRYPDGDHAAAAAARLRTQGHPDAHPRRVARPGGL